MLSDKPTVCPNNLLDIAHQKKGIKVGVVNAGKTLPMLSIMDSVKEKLIIPVLIGDENEIKKCADDIKFDISEYEIIHEPIENNTAKIAAKLASEEKNKNNCKRSYPHWHFNERSFEKRAQFIRQNKVKSYLAYDIGKRW